jgi:hypothetical protein
MRIEMSRRGRGRKNGMKQRLMKRRGKETRNPVGKKQETRNPVGKKQETPSVTKRMLILKTRLPIQQVWWYC